MIYLNIREYAALIAIKLAKVLTHNSGDIEQIYNFVDRLGFIWIVLMHIILILNIDQVILVPVGFRLIQIPLFMSSGERSVRDIFRPKKGEVVVDVGTYYGRYTLISSHYVGATGLVIGIEPDLRNYQIAKKNAENNNAKNVVLIRAAASNKEGIVRLFKAERLGTHSLVWNKRSKYEDVPCKTVDKLLSEIKVKKVDWLKIDVEGAELMVLEGSKQTLIDNEQMKLIIEIHRHNDKVLKFLRSMSYKVTFLEPKKIVPYHILASKN